MATHTVGVAKAQVLRGPNKAKVGALDYGTEVTVAMFMGDWAMVVNDWYPGEADKLTMRTGDLVAIVTEPQPNPDAPVVEITKVEGTVDGEPFIWP